MAFSVAEIKGEALYSIGTLATTTLKLPIHTDSVLLKSKTNDVRYRAYGKDFTVPADGAAAPADYMELDSTESTIRANPTPGKLPWYIVAWGAAGSETLLIEGR